MYRNNGKKRIAVLIAMLLVSTLLLSGCGQIMDMLGIELVAVDMGDLFDGKKADGAADAAKPVVMPQCEGLPYNDAVNALSDAGCVISIEYDFSDDVPEGYVISQSLPAEIGLKGGEEVTLVISKGPGVKCSQKVVVTAAAGSYKAKLKLMNLENGAWVEAFSCSATVGKNGISQDYGEGRKRTPAGEFKLGVALSKKAISNKEWPIYIVTKDTCMVDDPDSELYNTIQSIKSLPKGVSYDPIGKTLTDKSSVLIFIEHNGNGFDSENVVPGLCSVITICGQKSALKATSGCVDISSANMTKLIKLLDYSKNPMISISVK